MQTRVLSFTAQVFNNLKNLVPVHQPGKNGNSTFYRIFSSAKGQCSKEGASHSGERVQNLFSFSALAAGAAIVLLSGCTSSPSGFTSTTITTGTPCFVNSSPLYEVDGGYSSTQVVYANGCVGPLPLPFVNNVNVTKQISKNSVVNTSVVSTENNQVLKNNSVVSARNQLHQTMSGFLGIFHNHFGRPSSQINNSAISLKNEIKKNNSITSVTNDFSKEKPGFFKKITKNLRVGSRGVRDFLTSHHQHGLENHLSKKPASPKAVISSSHAKQSRRSIHSLLPMKNKEVRSKEKTLRHHIMKI